MVRWHDSGAEAICFDDVLIRPGYSELGSRMDATPWVSIRLPDNSTNMLSPIIAANMATIATPAMKTALNSYKVIVPAHRFQSIDDEIATINTLTVDTPTAGTVGLKERDRTERIAEVASIVFLELAHAHSKQVQEEIRWFKKSWPRKLLVVGNIATADATKFLMDSGADMVKVGIGPGSVCTTRLVTGTGVPQLSAILECAPCGPIIADGGIRNSGDIVKALAAGSHFVMIGGLFAGCDEAAGTAIGDTSRRVYYGMASKENGHVGEHYVPEGISAQVPYTGQASRVASNLIFGLRQGMAMVGAKNLTELREKAVFQRVSSSTIIENQPHITYRR